MSFPKIKRWISKPYIRFVSDLPCVVCDAEGDHVVAHHLKGAYSPYSGGMGRKASDLFTMPLCYEHHMDLHTGDGELRKRQAYMIFGTLEKATDRGILKVR
tara:strand:+ start:1299 stop:1601 length:303 start_codon:yes stop_codon:yes gene_type:complete